MMLSRTLIFIVVLIKIVVLVQSERVLFREGHVRFEKNHGKRQLVKDVQHFDQKIFPRDKHLLLVRTKSMKVVYQHAIRNLKNLKEVILKDCGIEVIEPTAFFNLPNLTVVHLEDNQIKEVKKGVFNGLSIKLLCIHRNEIKTIDTEAFDDMPNLYLIKLNSNKLKSWDSGWFRNTPRLTKIYFRRNRINYLPPSAFTNIRGGHYIDGNFVLDTKIFLSKNKLGEINPESFFNLEQISQLYLDRNGIQTLPDGAFRDLTDIDLIYLARNKIGEVKGKPFPNVRKIGFLDLSNNLLTCLPYELVTLANVTNLEKNNGTCDCVEDFKAKLKAEKRNSEISYDEESC